MLPELGHYALILALAVALTQGILPLIGAHRQHRGWIALARPGSATLFLLILTSFILLTVSFIQNDFSVAYVANHSNTSLPLIYRIAAVWGGHEGSLLLWTLMLALWSFAAARFSKQLPEAMVARVLAVLGLITVGFLLFILLSSNPFMRLFPIPPEGRSLNPLLQDPGLVIHPPMLYMGYVGFSVAYAFSIAALLSGEMDAAWARWSRPWTTAAWAFLTLGIALGSGWAYYELGWGGWWFWDPVENASLMPWLVGTALIHSLAVTEKRGSFKNWSILLAISAFSLSLIGTFLVRSGVLTSVHAFASDPGRGLFILGFLVIVIGSSLTLFAIRAPSVGLGGQFALFSRETLLLVNNVLFVVSAATILLGTLYPLIIDALGLGKLSVGPPYFEAVFTPIMLPLLFILGINTETPWKHAKFAKLRALTPAFIGALILGIGLPFLAPSWKPMVALSLFLSFWVMLTHLQQFVTRIKNTHSAQGWLAKCLRQPLAFVGMQLAHLGVAAFVIGVALVNGYATEIEVKMEPNDTVALAGYTFRFDRITSDKGPNYEALRGHFTLLKDGQALRSLSPEKRIYENAGMPMTEAAIDVGLFRDLYVSLNEPLDREKINGAWIVHVYHKPFIDWIWGGAALMALGGFLAIADRRYRLRRSLAKQEGMA